MSKFVGLFIILALVAIIGATLIFGSTNSIRSEANRIHTATMTELANIKP